MATISKRLMYNDWADPLGPERVRLLREIFLLAQKAFADLLADQRMLPQAAVMQRLQSDLRSTLEGFDSYRENEVRTLRAQVNELIAMMPQGLVALGVCVPVEHPAQQGREAADAAFTADKHPEAVMDDEGCRNG